MVTYLVARSNVLRYSNKVMNRDNRRSEYLIILYGKIMEKEIFKLIEINGEPTKYMISSLGRCFNVKSKKFIKPQAKKYINKALKQNEDSAYYEYYLYHKK